MSERQHTERSQELGSNPKTQPTIAQWWSDISERERIEIVGDCVGVWAFGGVQMCFALLPNDAKCKAYDAFIAAFCTPEGSAA